MKIRVQKLENENNLLNVESNILKSDNLNLKSELEVSKKNLTETQRKLSSFMKGKEVLDNLTQIVSNKHKKRLGFEGETSQILKKNSSKDSVIRFVRAFNQKSNIKQSLLHSKKFGHLEKPKTCLKTTSEQNLKTKISKPQSNYPYNKIGYVQNY